MKAPEHFEVMADHCCYRLSGRAPLSEAASMVIEAITYAREREMSKLLVDATQWTGHPSPSTLERYEVLKAFAEATCSLVKVAVLVRPEMVDHEKFGVKVAKNRDMDGNVFDSKKEALAWLLNPAVR